MIAKIRDAIGYKLVDIGIKISTFDTKYFTESFMLGSDIVDKRNLHPAPTLNPDWENNVRSHCN